MKKLKFISLVLAMLQVLSFNSNVYAVSSIATTSAEDFVISEELELEKNRILESIKEQLIEQGQEEKYDLYFKPMIENEFMQISAMYNGSYSDYYYFPDGGAISYNYLGGDGLTMCLDEEDTIDFYYESTRSTLIDFVAYVTLFLSGPVGAVFDVYAIARNIMNTRGWDEVMYGSRRAKLVTVSDADGTGTIVYEWIDFPMVFLPYGVDNTDVYAIKYY